MGLANQRFIRLMTIGHSTRPVEAFIDLLRAHGVLLLVDVRSIPGSKKYPQFNQEALQQSLAQSEIRYLWLPSLGGRRRPVQPRSESNAGLRSSGFRNYADYMATREFRQGVEMLLELARREPTAIMCAEAVYWRCHRRLIADYLTVQGVDVQHILGRQELRPHQLTPGIQVHEGGVAYPPPALPGQ